MIVVAGEALIDLVVRPGGQVDARPGGGPYNAARTLARLGAETAFLDRLSGDTFGVLLRDRLIEAGVTLAVTAPSAAPTTLALVNVDLAGVPSYAFYLNGTAAADLNDEHLNTAFAALATRVAAVHIGSLGLLMEPIGGAIERLIGTDPGTDVPAAVPADAPAALPADALVLLDPNCRPGVAANPEAYRERLIAIAHRADIVKASVEDLAYLYPGQPVTAAAAGLRAAGSALILVTDGPRPARAFLPGPAGTAGTPATSGPVLTAAIPAVPVADTIGAGDAFGGGFLAWWTAHGLGRDVLNQPELVKAALTAAVGVAALTCARPGADPPALAEVKARGWWPEAQ